MSILVPINGTNYIIPEPNEVGWGSNLDAFFVAISAGVFQKTGGNFVLSAEADFGSSFGLKSLYYKSRGANISSTGVLRLNNNSDSISFRNAANNADLPLIVNSSDQLSFNGTPIGGSGIYTTNRAIVSDGSGNLSVSPTTSTEIGYVSGVTSAIQTQFASVVHLTGSETISGSKTFSATQLFDPSSGAAISIHSGTALQFLNSANNRSITFVPPTLPTSITYTLPSSVPATNGDILSSTTAGVMSWLSTLPVANGGTGNSSLTAFNILAAGTTSTGALQTISVGASGQVLTSNGAGALPSFQNVSGTGTVNSGTQFQLGYYATSTNVISGLTLITGSRALVSDANGLPVAATTTATEIGFVNGVTSAIQTQLNLKAPLASPTFTGTVATAALTATSFVVTAGNINAISATNNSSSSAALLLNNSDASGANMVFQTATATKVQMGSEGRFLGNTSQNAYIAAGSGLAINLYANASTTASLIVRASDGAVAIQGTTTNDSATAGLVGQTITSGAVTTAFPSSTNYGDLTSISLTAGDWLVTAVYDFSAPGSATTLTHIGISTTTGNSSTGLTDGDNHFLAQFASSTNYPMMTVPSYRMSLSGTTTVYLKFNATYSGTTPSGTGRLSAVRIR